LDPTISGVDTALAVSCLELWSTITRRPTGRNRISVIDVIRIAVFSRW
jgi:hypothetical protein